MEYVINLAKVEPQYMCPNIIPCLLKTDAHQLL